MISFPLQSCQTLRKCSYNSPFLVLLFILFIIFLNQLFIYLFINNSILPSYYFILLYFIFIFILIKPFFQISFLGTPSFHYSVLYLELPLFLCSSFIFPTFPMKGIFLSLPGLYDFLFTPPCTIAVNYILAIYNLMKDKFYMMQNGAVMSIVLFNVYNSNVLYLDLNFVHLYLRVATFTKNVISDCMIYPKYRNLVLQIQPSRSSYLIFETATKKLLSEFGYSRMNLFGYF